MDGGLLEYKVNRRRWVWEEVDVNSCNMSDNVISLIISKISGLSSSTLRALKAASCFGMVINQHVVDVLSASLEHWASCISSQLEQVVKEGFMVRVEHSGFTFVDKKVQNEVYRRISEAEKSLVSECCE